MPDAGPKSDIEQSVGNDPHVGTDHGFVEWVRVVKGQGSLLAVPLSSSLSSSFEAWRPIMESSCGNAIWEWNVHSGAWNADWQQSTQWPYLYRADWLNGTGMWPDPKTPGTARARFRAGDGLRGTEPAPEQTQHPHPRRRGDAGAGAALPSGPERPSRSGEAALAEAGKAVARAVPGYVLAPDLKDSPALFIATLRY